MSTSESELLVVLIDLHPVWWSDHKLSEVVQSVLVLLNSHLLNNPLNQVGVVFGRNRPNFVNYQSELVI